MASPAADPEQCWICLDDASEDGSVALVSPCKCPRKVHPQCLARWQLQQAGRHEEKFCRFCNTSLADWKANLTPRDLAPEVPKVQPVMVVYFEGQIHRIPVKQGPDGLAEFQAQIRDLFRLPDDVDISLTFGCKEPMSGQHLKLEGIGAFDAAVHCASVAAADRQQRIKRSQSAGPAAGCGAGVGCGATPGTAGGAPGAARSASSHELRGVAGGPASPPAAAGPYGGGAPQQQYTPQLGPIVSGGGASGGHSLQASPFAAPALQAPVAASQAAGSFTLPSPGGSPPRVSLSARAVGTAAAAAPAPSAVATAALGAGSATAAATLPAVAAPVGRNALKLPGGAERVPPPSAPRGPLGRWGLAAPGAGSALAVGGIAEATVSGKLRLSLRAFSQKVARSLSFSQRSASTGALAAASGTAAAAACTAAAAEVDAEPGAEAVRTAEAEPAQPLPAADAGASGSRTASLSAVPPAPRAASPVATCQAAAASASAGAVMPLKAAACDLLGQRRGTPTYAIAASSRLQA